MCGRASSPQFLHSTCAVVFSAWCERRMLVRDLEVLAFGTAMIRLFSTAFFEELDGAGPGDRQILLCWFGAVALKPFGGPGRRCRRKGSLHTQKG